MLQYDTQKLSEGHHEQTVPCQKARMGRNTDSKRKDPLWDSKLVDYHRPAVVWQV